MHDCILTRPVCRTEVLLLQRSELGMQGQVERYKQTTNSPRNELLEIFPMSGNSYLYSKEAHKYFPQNLCRDRRTLSSGDERFLPDKVHLTLCRTAYALAELRFTPAAPAKLKRSQDKFPPSRLPTDKTVFVGREMEHESSEARKVVSVT